MDSVDNTLDERKQQKLAQMTLRNQVRKDDLQSKSDERQATTSTNAGRKTFEQEYPVLKSQIEELFGRLAINRDENAVQDLAERIQKLEKFVTEHVEILRSRDVANAQSTFREGFEFYSREVLLADVMKLRAQLNSLQGATLSSSHRIDFSQIHDEPPPTEQPPVVSPAANLPVSSNTISISNKANELIRLDASDLNGKDVAIENLTQCEIFLKGVPSSIQIKNLQACILVVGPCHRSILIDQCTQCEFALACQQLRIHTSTECDFYVHITAQPIIEDCTNLRFAPYNVEYKLKNEHIQQSGLTWTRDYWNDVRDFNHMVVGAPSPNWQIIEEEGRKEWSLD